MKARAVLAVAMLVGLPSIGFAAENGKASALTSYQLGDYSLGLDTDNPNKPDSTAPLGLSTLRQDTIQPFVGLKLSGPLPDHFWNLGQTADDQPAPVKAKPSKHPPVRPKMTR
jgi:hypothetical protein